MYKKQRLVGRYEPVQLVIIQLGKYTKNFLLNLTEKLLDEEMEKQERKKQRKEKE